MWVVFNTKEVFVSGENLFSSKRGEGGKGTGAPTPRCRDASGSHRPISNLSGKRCLHCAGMDGSGGPQTPGLGGPMPHTGIWAAAEAAQLCHHTGLVGTEGTAGAIATAMELGRGRINKITASVESGEMI